MATSFQSIISNLQSKKLNIRIRLAQVALKGLQGRISTYSCSPPFARFSITKHNKHARRPKCKCADCFSDQFALFGSCGVRSALKYGTNNHPFAANRALIGFHVCAGHRLPYMAAESGIAAGNNDICLAIDTIIGGISVIFAGSRDNAPIKIGMSGSRHIRIRVSVAAIGALMTCITLSFARRRHNHGCIVMPGGFDSR